MFFVSVVLAVFIVVVLVFGFNLTGYITGFFVADSGYDLEGFAKCLTDKGAVLYTSTGCPHCQDQKELFGEALQHVENVDCVTDPNVCSENGIRVVPTWIINNERYEGVRTLEELGELTGCEPNE